MPGAARTTGSSVGQCCPPCTFHRPPSGVCTCPPYFAYTTSMTSPMLVVAARGNMETPGHHALLLDTEPSQLRVHRRDGGFVAVADGDLPVRQQVLDDRVG